MSSGVKTKILWGLFIYTILVVVLDVYLNLSGYQNLELINILTLTAPVILFLFHAVWSLGIQKSFALITIAASLGWVGEVVGIKFEFLFGGAYLYTENKLGPEALGVPLLIPAFWAVFYYTCYWLTNALLKASPRKEIALWKLIMLDIALIVSIDLFMDPIFVHEGFWRWMVPGAYFDVPYGNFIGWGIVSGVISFVVRKWVLPIAENNNRMGEKIGLIPVIGYVSLGLTFTLCALVLSLNTVAVIGFLLMIPVSIYGLMKLVRSN